MPTNPEPVRIAWHIDTGFVGADYEGEWQIDRTRWDQLAPDDRLELLADYCQEEIENHIGAGWNVENADVDDPTVEA